MLHMFMFQMFHLFQSYVAASVFMLQVASVLSGCCSVYTCRDYNLEVSQGIDKLAGHVACNDKTGVSHDPFLLP
jgi:hypothetical protein